MIKLIVFDLWNTLVPTSIDWPHLVYITKKQHMSLAELIPKYESTIQKKRINSFEELRKTFFAAFDQVDNLLLEQELYEIYVNRLDKIYFFPDIEENLTKLRNQGYKLALLSNTENIAFDKVKEKIPIVKYFDFLCLSCDVGSIKPEKTIFEVVLKNFGVSPYEALMVGDSLRSDVAGAQNVGMHACWLNRPKKSYDLAKVKPEFEINTLNDIYKVLGVLNAKFKRTNG